MALTATNAGGQQHQYQDQLHHGDFRPLPVANFTGTPTSWDAPLSRAASPIPRPDTPTSWSWAFGDTYTSTSQNPSHTYNTTGTYTVALTATNAGGNNTCTKTGYISVGNTAVYYPTCEVYYGSLASGTDANLTADDGVYEVYNCSTDAHTGDRPAALVHHRLYVRAR